jgi:predicted nucleic acid-binding protein
MRCDALFVELARRARLPLATFDRAVLTAFPAIAKRPRALL